MQRKFSFAKRTNVPDDPIDAIFQQIPFLDGERAKKKLAPIINLCVGEPHLSVNVASIEAVATFLKQKNAKFAFGYPPLEGDAATRNAITKLYQHYYPTADYKTDQVMICNGATQGLWNALSLLVDEGDKVLAFEPFYSTYQNQVSRLGGEFVKISTYENKFRPSGKQLEAALLQNAKVKVLILNYPNNPSGVDLSYEEVKEIAEVLKKHPDITIIWDDVYRELTQGKHITLLDVDPCLKDRSIMINSGSKGLIGAPGMRIGMVGANADFINQMVTLQANMVSSINLFSELALTATITSKLENDPRYTQWISDSKQAYQQNMQFVSHHAKQLGFKIVNGGHGFFLLLDASFLLGLTIPDSSLQENRIHTKFVNDKDIMLYFLHCAGVALVPGSGFGIDEKLGYLRISCAKDETVLKMAMTNIQQAIEKIPGVTLDKDKSNFARFYTTKNPEKKTEAAEYASGNRCR